MKPIPKLALAPGLPSLIYLGCNAQAGHYFYVPGMRSLHSVAPVAREANYHELAKLDGGFAPQDTELEGSAWFHNERVGDIRYMVISFWDRSVDSRGGSCSTFLMLGDKCFDDALAECRAQFPEVFRRFKFEIKLREAFV